MKIFRNVYLKKCYVYSNSKYYKTLKYYVSIDYNKGSLVRIEDSTGVQYTSKCNPISRAIQLPTLSRSVSLFVGV